MEDKVVMENESEANETPENKFACLGIADCQQVLERLKGEIVMDQLPYAVKALLDEYKYDEDTLGRAVAERMAELEHHRKKAVELHIAKKYAQALEAYDKYFQILGSQVADHEAEQLRTECQQYVLLAKKKKIQTIAVSVVALVLFAVIVDQVFFWQNVKAFRAALQDRNKEDAVKAAVKISWRYDTGEGISNLGCFLDEKNKFDQLLSKEINQSSLDNYGGVDWLEVQKLVKQADTNEDLPEGIRQLEQASKTTRQLLADCVVLEEKERDFNAMYQSCNQTDAGYYAPAQWEQLQQLRGAEVTQTNLNLIVERYNLMVEITNRVAGLMDLERKVKPIKKEFERMMEEEQIQVQGMLNYSSSKLDEAKRLAGIAAKKEETFDFPDALGLYISATNCIRASQIEREEDSAKLDKIEQARREFNELYNGLDDVGLAQEKYSDQWDALMEKKEEAESEYGREERWEGDAYACYEAASAKLKRLMGAMEDGDKVGESRNGFNQLFGNLDIGLAEKWFPAKSGTLFEQKKKADAAYERGDNWEEVNVCYEVASQSLEDLTREISIKAKIDFLSAFNSKGNQIKNLSGGDYQEEWSNVQKLAEQAEREYAKPRYWEGNAYELYINAEHKLSEIYATAVDNRDIIVFDMSGSQKEADSLILESSGTSTNGVPKQ